MITRLENGTAKSGRGGTPGLGRVPVTLPGGASKGRLEGFKNRLLRSLLKEAPNPASHLPLQRAADEAAALVWVTPYPLLLLPVLLQEKAEIAREQVALQQRIRRRSLPLLENVGG